MRITKDIAEIVAKKMLEEKSKKNQKVLESLKLKIYDQVFETMVPKLVNKFMKDDLGDIWLKKSKGVILSGNGFNHEYIDILPFPSTTGSTYVHMTPDKEIAKNWRKTYDDYQKEKDKITKLRREISALLYNLKTYSKVSNEFPEAFPHLPEKQETGLSICVEDIRKELK
jgi:hypothetical protein